jgi:hypothetical protein
MNDGDNMAKRSIEERLAQLDARRKALQSRLSQQGRAQDTRRKILIGALVLRRLEANPDVAIGGKLADWVTRELPGFLTRDIDKALFADLIGETAASVPADTASAREPQAA